MITATRSLLLLHALLVPAVVSGQIAHQDTTRSAGVFRQLSSLVGDWKGMKDSVPIEVTYSLTADGTALMMKEAMQPPGKPPVVMITMFTVDGDHLIGTHYCSVGNQPQMMTRNLDDLAAEGLTFSLLRVTGMKTPDDWHNTGLTITQSSDGHLTHRWTWLYQGTPGTSVFVYDRK